MTTKTAGAETEHDPIREFVDEYEFRGDAGAYTPTEAERVMLEDFAHGLIDHFNFRSTMMRPLVSLPPRKRQITGRSALRVGAVDGKEF